VENVCTALRAGLYSCGQSVVSGQYVRVCAWVVGDDDGHSLDHAQKLSVTTESQPMAEWSDGPNIRPMGRSFGGRCSAIDVGKYRIVTHTHEAP